MTLWLRNTLQIVLAFAAGTAAVVWLSGGCGDRIGPEDSTLHPAPTPDSARVEEVREQEAMRFERVSGTISSARHTTISSKILARIESISVRAGDEVEGGALLVKLDSRDLQARLNGAREATAAARAALDLAKSELERVTRLHESAIASQQQLDQATAGQDVATAELQRAEQSVADAEVALSYAEIRSPVAGRVVDRLAEPGDTAAPGVALVRIYDPGAMRIEAPVRERLATRLKPGQVLEVEVEALDLSVEGTIDELVPAAEPGARTFLIKVRLPHDPRLFAGMFGRVSIPAGVGRRLVVPNAAITRIGQLEYVTIVGHDSGHHRRLITTGPAVSAAEVEVLSGLAAGERVVLR